jgi:hypothetical protein
MIRRKTPKALAEVWAWKGACYRDVAHLPTREAIKKRLADCARTARRLGLAPPETPASPHRTARVAESAAPYAAKRTRKAQK